MIASNIHTVVQPAVNGVHRIRYFFAVDNNFPNAESSFSTENGETNAVMSFGFDVSRLFLTLSTRQTQFIRTTVTVGETDLSRYLVGNVQIDWPDESGGSASLSFVQQNPFLEGAIIDVEEEVDIVASLQDPTTNERFSVRIFKGKIVQYDFNPDTGVTSVSCQDGSRDVSHETSRLNREILGVDPVLTEHVTCRVASKLTVSSNIDVDQPTPVLGVWAESDTGFADNLTEQDDFLIETDRRTLSFFGSGLVNANSNYVVRYLIPLSQFSIPQISKSQVVQLIASLAGITTVQMERAGHSEDEIVGVNITANNELPLDLIRKIVVPQTWKVEYNESGDLVIRREQLKEAANADFTFDESNIIEGSLNITKDIDSVINEIRVAGIIKRLGGNVQAGLV